MSRQKGSVNELVERALSVFEQFRKSSIDAERYTLFYEAYTLLTVTIPSHPGYSKFVTQKSPMHEYYVQLCSLAEVDKKSVDLDLRYHKLRRSSHGAGPLSQPGPLLNGSTSGANGTEEVYKQKNLSSSKIAEGSGSKPLVNGANATRNMQAGASSAFRLSKIDTQDALNGFANGIANGSRLGTNGVKGNGMKGNGMNVNGMNVNGMNVNGVNGNGVNGNGVNVNGMNGNGMNVNSMNGLNGATNGTINGTNHPPKPLPYPVSPQKPTVISELSPSILYNKMKVSKVLLIDLRPSTDYDRAHIAHDLITNFDPQSVHLTMSDQDLQDSLVISDDKTSFESFAERGDADLLCVYDENSVKASDSLPLQALFAVLTRSRLKPYLLRGGFDAWRKQHPREVAVGTRELTPPAAHAPLPPAHKAVRKPAPSVPPKVPAATTASQPHTPPQYSQHSPPKAFATAHHLTSRSLTERAPYISPHPMPMPMPHRPATVTAFPTVSPPKLSPPRAPPKISPPHAPSAFEPERASPPKLSPHNSPPHNSLPHGSPSLKPTRMPPPPPMHVSMPAVPPPIPVAVPVDTAPVNTSSPPPTTKIRPMDGYMDKPAKVTLPSLRVPKLLSNGGATTAAVLPALSLPTQKAASPIHVVAPPYVEEDVPLRLMSNTGLKNLGNTCYMNCVLQCLAGFPELSAPFIDGSYERHINFRSRIGHRGHFSHAFAGLMRALSDSSTLGHAAGCPRHVITPDFLKHVAAQLRPDDFAGYEQQDCQEFLTFVLDELHEDLNANGHKPKLGELSVSEENAREAMGIRAASAIEWERYLDGDTSLIVDRFQGQYLSRLECSVCHHTSTTYNAFSSLSLPIVTRGFASHHCSLKACFDEFVKPEVLQGDNAWFCPHCQTKRRTTKTMQISRLPPILVIHLKRFKRSSNGVVNKLETPVDYPLRDLDLTRYWPQLTHSELGSKEAEILNNIPRRGQEPPFVYDLRAVTLHSGSLKGGHYTAVVHKPRIGWMHYDDAITTPVREQAAISKNAYVLFYKRRM